MRVSFFLIGRLEDWKNWNAPDGLMIFYLVVVLLLMGIYYRQAFRNWNGF